MSRHTAKWRDDIRGGPPRGQSGRPVQLTGRTRRARSCESGVMVETARYGWWDSHWFAWNGNPPRRQ